MPQVDLTTFLADFKNVYGAIFEQISTAAAFWNLLQKGPMENPISNIGGRGYTFLARLSSNWNMGYRPEGTGGVGQAGATGIAQATVTLTYAYAPEVMTGQAINLSKGNERAFMQAKALELKYDMKDLISHLNVVMVGAERGGQLAQVLTGASGSFVASRVGGLPGALLLRVGMPVDTNAVGGGALSVSNNIITAINYETDTVTLTDAETAVTGEAVTLAGEAALTTGTFPYTAEGLVSLISNTGARQGLNPATAGQASWQSFLQDVGGNDISSQSIDEQIAFTETRSGATVDLGIFPPAQLNNLTRIATQTMRFETANQTMPVAKRALDLGYSSFTYGGRTIVREKDCRADRTYWGASEAIRLFEAIPLSMANDEAGEWTRLIASGSVADAIGGLIRGYHQLGMLQRSAWSVYKGYTVPAAWQNQPVTI